MEKKMNILGKIGNYTIIKRESKFHPYVCAYGYNEDNEDWAQGTYFETFEKATAYAHGLRAGITAGRLSELADCALHYIQDIDGTFEDFYEEWGMEELNEDEQEYFGL